MLSVSRAIGDIQFKKSGLSSEPDVTRFSIEEDDSLLVLTTDGLINCLGQENLVETVNQLFKKDGSYGNVS